MLKKTLGFISGSVLCVALSSSLFAEEKVLKVATLDWEPYIGQNMPNNGYVAELMKEAFRRVGYSIKLEYLPWARAIEESKLCKHDALMPEYMDEERKKDFIYSEKYPGGPLGFYKKKDKQIKWSGKLEELKGLKVGTVRGYVNPEDFEKDQNIIKEQATDDETNIKKLEKDRLDLMIVDKFVAAYIIGAKFPSFTNVLEFMEPPLVNYDLYTLFPKKCENSEKLKNDFNMALKEMYDDGTVDKVLKKYNFK